MFAGSGLLTGGRGLTGFMNIPRFRSLGVRLDPVDVSVDLLSLLSPDLLAGFDWDDLG